MASYVSGTPSAVRRAIDVRLQDILAHWRNAAVIDGSDCVWTRLPGELLRAVFEYLSPWSLASLLAAGSRALMHAAVCTNPDLVVDALWWRLWNLVPGDRCTEPDTCLFEAGCPVAAAWMYGDLGDSTLRDVAIDHGDPLTSLSAHVAGVTRNPTGVAALALSCARSCSDRGLVAVLNMAARPRACSLPTGGPLWRTKEGRLCHTLHSTLVTHLLVQLTYADRYDAFCKYASTVCERDIDEDHYVDGTVWLDHVALTEVVNARRAPMTRSESLALAYRHVPLIKTTPRIWGPHRCDYTPLSSWLPAAALALLVGKVERAGSLVRIGLYAAIIYEFHCDTYGTWYGHEMARIVEHLCMGHRIGDLADTSRRPPAVDRYVEREVAHLTSYIRGESFTKSLVAALDVIARSRYTSAQSAVLMSLADHVAEIEALLGMPGVGA
ncbi:hypothetical protein psal_cds_1060 [Pandoravirus salinus]|uniref:F-box domain containing protein n=1 Tax=Pandoravirus salinus TaxID=1349410 RepID=S4VX61_9VIRU|nr:hypothetical protein psal_cds_1060 [Pandoravirus salinus]AGO85264.1 hypothetical protein psal_cds_1060 [Pandoravirus salinus]